MKKLPYILLPLVFLLIQGCGVVPLSPAYAPRAANKIAAQMDAQIMQRAHINSSVIPSEERAMRQQQLRESITVMATVPVDINNLEVSCPLARQMSEEVSRWMISKGYKFQEIRKGKEVFFQKKQGEMLLTRDTSLLAKRNVSSIAVLAGTYVITPEQVRFSMRLIHTPSNEVIAMGTATVPITPDIRPLLSDDNQGQQKVTPTINTKL